MDKKAMIQLPPIPADTDGKLIAAFWEFIKLSKEDQDLVAEQLRLLTEGREEYETDMRNGRVRKISDESFDVFRSYIETLISACIVESTNVTALIAKKYFADRRAVDEIQNEFPQNREYVESLIMIFQKLESENSVKS